MTGTYPIRQDRHGLGRHVHHDPASRRFPFIRGTASSYRPPAVMHIRHIPIFDQGQIGDCTAETGLGLMGTGVYWDALCAATGSSNPTGAGPYPFNQDGCQALYTDITANDPYEGQWPDADTGSDGLSMAKALQTAGIIPGYEHTFTAADALRALASRPLAVGTLWTDSMFRPDHDGLIRYTGPAVGGHEWILDEYAPGPDWVGGTTSWGESFGDRGRFYLSVADFTRLLADDGDVIVLTPPLAPAPAPVPDPAASADGALVDAFEMWRKAKGL
jgi:hypothetical protein